MNHFCIVSRDDVSMNFLTPTFLTTIFNMFLPVSINLFWERSNIVMVGNKIQKSEKLMSHNVHNCSWIMIWRCPFSSISSTLHFSKRTFEKITCSENRIGHTWGVFFERCFDRSLRNAPYMYHAAVERVFPRLDLRQFVQINVK